MHLALVRVLIRTFMTATKSALPSRWPASTRPPCSFKVIITMIMLVMVVFLVRSWAMLDYTD